MENQKVCSFILSHSSSKNNPTCTPLLAFVVVMTGDFTFAFSAQTLDQHSCHRTPCDFRAHGWSCCRDWMWTYKMVLGIKLLASCTECKHWTMSQISWFSRRNLMFVILCRRRWWSFHGMGSWVPWQSEVEGLLRLSFSVPGLRVRIWGRERFGQTRLELYQERLLACGKDWFRVSIINPLINAVEKQA